MSGLDDAGVGSQGVEGTCSASWVRPAFCKIWGIEIGACGWPGPVLGWPRRWLRRTCFKNLLSGVLIIREAV